MLITSKLESSLIRTLKPVAFIVLLAFVSPALLAASDCIGKGLAAGHCQPDCPMMETNTHASNQISATPAGGSCCKVSSRLPASNRATITPQTSMAGTVEVVVSAPHASLTPDRLIRVQGTAPPACTSSHQALLCTFLV